MDLAKLIIVHLIPKLGGIGHLGAKLALLCPFEDNLLSIGHFGANYVILRILAKYMSFLLNRPFWT